LKGDVAMKHLKHGTFIALIVLIILLPSFSILSETTANHELNDEIPAYDASYEEKAVHSCVVADAIMLKIAGDASLEDKLGGIYIDDEGRLNILYVGDYSGLDFGSEEIIYHPAIYTKKHLLEVYTRLSDHAMDFGIISVCVDEINNRVVVGIDDIRIKGQVKDILAFGHSDAIVVEEIDHRVKAVTTLGFG
jgi:hypothetical protein